MAESALLAPNATPPAPSLRIRETRDDAALLALFNEAHFQHNATHMARFVDVEHMRVWLSGLGADKCEIVAALDGELAGFATLFCMQDRQNHIGWFFLGVREKFCGQGVGATLLRALLRIADDMLGLERVQLTVYADNAAAIALYRTFGFEFEGRHKKFLRRDECFVDGLSMARFKPAAVAPK